MEGEGEGGRGNRGGWKGGVGMLKDVGRVRVE